MNEKDETKDICFEISETQINTMVHWVVYQGHGAADVYPSSLADAGAMAVIDQMFLLDYTCQLQHGSTRSFYAPGETSFKCTFAAPGTVVKPDNQQYFTAYGKTRGEAICKAALMALIGQMKIV